MKQIILMSLKLSVQFRKVFLPDNVSAERDDVLHHSGDVQPYSDLHTQKNKL